MTIIPVDSLADPRLEPYRSLKQTNLTRDSGLFIAEGKLVVERLLASRYAVRSVLLSERRLPLLPLLPELPRRDGLDVYVVSEAAARELLGFDFHAGVLACGIRGTPATIEDLPLGTESLSTDCADGVDELCANCPEPLLCVACPQMTDPDNLGSLIRLARAFGVAGLLLGHGCCDPLSRRTLRVSMGNAFELPLVESRDLAADLRRLQRRGFTVTATVVSPEATPLHATARSPRDILLLGNEAHGLGPEWVALADRRVTIPMHSGVDSLNVTLAAGICLHWLRHGGPPA